MEESWSISLYLVCYEDGRGPTLFSWHDLPPALRSVLTLHYAVKNTSIPPIFTVRINSLESWMASLQHLCRQFRPPGGRGPAEAAAGPSGDPGVGCVFIWRDI